MIRLLRKEVVYVNVLGAALILVLCLTAAEPARKWPIGKETTYITEPLDDEGYIDYEAALNDRLGKGITPENNANVLIWKALGPRPEGGNGIPAECFRWVGIESPAQEGDYFVALHNFAKKRLKLDPEDVEELEEQDGVAMKQPWSAEAHPQLGEWLKANEKPLALLVEATKRPSYFNPLISPRTLLGKTRVSEALIPSVQVCRSVASALLTRAMLRVNEKKFEDAWQDLLACHRLSRFVGRGAGLIEGLVGVAITAMVYPADIAYIANAGLSAKEIKDRLKDLQDLPPVYPLADVVDLGERLMFLDGIQLLRRRGPEYLDLLEQGKEPKEFDRRGEKAMSRIDWDPILRDINDWFSLIATALRIQNRAERELELSSISSTMDSQIRKSLNRRSIMPSFIEDLFPRNTGRSVDSFLAGPNYSILKVREAYDRNQQMTHNLSLAFALAGYRSDNGTYPAKLDDLAPKYIAEVPKDFFSGKNLIYRPTEKCYLFYSVGVNGKDEGGRSYDDDPQGDDLVVRMPLPELNVKPRK